MEGGNPGQTGLNLWLIKVSVTGEDRTVNIGGKESVPMGVGDCVVIMTPGGGWGSPEMES
jgi:5-oxoprolinase (ATP-hydrolysing)